MSQLALISGFHIVALSGVNSISYAERAVFFVERYTKMLNIILKNDKGKTTAIMHFNNDKVKIKTTNKQTNKQPNKQRKKETNKQT